MTLNQQELLQLTDLLTKVDNDQIKGDVWHELVKKFITVTVELIILDDRDRVFLVYRDDREFNAYHFPGTVINDWETASEARKRLVKNEISDVYNFEISEPEPIGWLQGRRGKGADENPTRHTVALLHLARLKGVFSGNEGANFFPVDALPENTLGDQKCIIERIRRYLRDGQIILGDY